MAELSNNPFIDHTSSALSRFPNINAVSSSPTGPSAPNYSTGWPQHQQQQQQSPGYVTSPTGYTQPQQYFQQQQQWPQQQQQQQQQYQQQMQAPYPPTNFQSPGSFGQQFVGQVNPHATGYPQSQMQGQYADYPTQQAASYSYQQPQQTGYAYPPPQQHQQQQLLSQFDPYANLGQQFSPPNSSTSSNSAVSPSIGPGAVGSPPPGVQHPRVFIQTHKAELEAWDPPTWRQVQTVFEALKIAWESRKRVAESQVRALGGTVGAPPSSGGASATGFFGAAGYGSYGGYGGGYPTPQAQGIDRLNSVLAYLRSFRPFLSDARSLLQLIKEANSNIGAFFLFRD
jgi:hypothetical protein